MARNSKNSNPELLDARAAEGVAAGEHERLLEGNGADGALVWLVVGRHREPDESVNEVRERDDDDERV